MHEMLTTFTSVRDVCLSVSLSRGLNRRRRMQCTPRAVCAGSFGAAFANRRPTLCVFKFVYFAPCSRDLDLDLITGRSHCEN